MVEQRISDVAGWCNSWHEKGWHFIHLVRRNVVRQAISNFVRQASGVVHRTTNDELIVPRIEVDVAQTVRNIRTRLAYQQIEVSALANVPHEYVEYERDLMATNAQQQTADRLFRHLGIAPAPVSTNMARTSTDDLRQVISNFDELAGALKGSGLESMLSDSPS